MAKILIVDDDPTLLYVLSSLLQTEGYKVVATQRGDKASEMIQADPDIDLVISDVRMNPVAGMEVLQLVQEERPDLPVIMITAYYSRETSEEALKLGAFAYLAKPWRTEELLNLVRKAVAGEKAR